MSSRVSFEQLARGGHEAWELEVVDDLDGGLGLTVGLVLHRDAAWFWAVLCRATADTVGVIELDIELPRSPSLEIRASGLWAEIGIQTPGEHLSVDLEAFGLAVDEADTLIGDALGIRVPVGLDVEWHRSSPCEQIEGGVRVGARVEGEILVGPESIELSRHASGSWVHRGGEGPWCGPTEVAAADGPVVATAAVAVGEWAWRDHLVRRGGVAWTREPVRP